MYFRAVMQHDEYFNNDSKNNDNDSDQLFHKHGFSRTDNTVAQIQ